MRWPWSKTAVEKRSYTSEILAAVFQHAATESADAGKSAAVETGAGFLARALQGAEVEGPGWVRDMISPVVLSQIGRGLIRRGSSVWAVESDSLTEAGYWIFEHGATADRNSWRCRVTDHGPSGSRTRLLPWNRIVFTQWGHDPALPWAPAGPMQFASLTAAMASNTEQALGHEAATPVGAVLEIPAEGWDDDELGAVKNAINQAKGRIFFADAMKVGDKSLEPDSGWKQKHIGPMPTDALVEIGKDSFHRSLAAMGLPIDLFAGGGNSQGQREAARRAHLNLIMPVTKMIQHELRDKLDTDLRIRHDTHFLDMVSRSIVIEKLTGAGVALNVALDAVALSDA